ncbi:MAG TPA: phage antirepressor N-terminal domain-containing protein [Anaerolineae bacterium]|nr:phage antirepressor N-terminal domain-containing protein [Anaerolineae bacterium]
MSESTDQSLATIEQKTVLFYDDELIAIRASDENVYVSVRHLCDVLGLNRRGQVQRIQRTTVLDRGYRRGTIDTGGGPQEAGLLRVDLVPLWLAGLSTRSLKPEIQPRIERYQDEAAKVLWEAFQDGRLSTTDSADLPDLTTADSPAAHAYRMAAAIMQMARQQLLLEAHLKNHTAQLGDHEQRLEELEILLGDPQRHITPDQASQISQAVKTVAMLLGKQSGKNEYGGVYGELYRQFGITSYKQLPAKQFDQAMSWLRDWWSTLAEQDEIPF